MVVDVQNVDLYWSSYAFLVVICLYFEIMDWGSFSVLGEFDCELAGVVVWGKGDFNPFFQKKKLHPRLDPTFISYKIF